MTCGGSKLFHQQDRKGKVECSKGEDGGAAITSADNFNVPYVPCSACKPLGWRRSSAIQTLAPPTNAVPLCSAMNSRCASTARQKHETQAKKSYLFTQEGSRGCAVQRAKGSTRSDQQHVKAIERDWFEKVHQDQMSNFVPLCDVLLLIFHIHNHELHLTNIMLSQLI